MIEFAVEFTYNLFLISGVTFWVLMIRALIGKRQ